MRADIKEAPVRVGRIGTIWRTLSGIVCSTCGGSPHYLALRADAGGRLYRLEARCSRCRKSQSLTQAELEQKVFGHGVPDETRRTVKRVEP